MSRIYIGAGHGRKPDGTYDPGAVHRKAVEHALAHKVVEACAGKLARHTLRIERDSGAGHDPNYAGSVQKANAWPADYAMEVHFNAGGGTGSEVWIAGTGGRSEAWAREIAPVLADNLGLRNRGVKIGNFSFLTKTWMPAVLIEVAFVDGDYERIMRHPDSFCGTAGEAIAEATNDFLETEDDMALSDEDKAWISQEIQWAVLALTKHVCAGEPADTRFSDAEKARAAAYIGGASLDAVLDAVRNVQGGSGAHNHQ